MRISHLLKKLYHGLLPFTCILCHHPSQRELDLCEPCHNELPILTHSCSACASELTDTSLCNECQNNPPPFDATYALFSYNESIKRLVLNLKFNDALLNAHLFGKLMTDKIRQHWYHDTQLPEVIIPIPLHKKRLKKRGFNQAVEIARPIVSILRIPIDISSCERIKYTTAQATLEAEKRATNVKNAFIVHEDFSNRHIAILDDVITTGHTVTEFAHCLKNAGAKRIDVWCCARATMR
jgi:ComF family protein